MGALSCLLKILAQRIVKKNLSNKFKSIENQEKLLKTIINRGKESLFIKNLNVQINNNYNRNNDV